MSPTKTRDVVALLVCAGTWLLMPPMLSVVGGPGALFGIPAVVVYLFVVWLALIVLTLALARRASGEGEDQPGPVDPDRGAA